MREGDVTVFCEAFQLKAGKEKSDKEDGVIDNSAKNP